MKLNLKNPLAIIPNGIDLDQFHPARAPAKVKEALGLPGNSRLVGTVREKDVIEIRNREMLRRDLAGGLSSSVSVAGHGQRVDLGSGYSLQEILAPHHALGKSLSQLDLRARTGVHVLLMRRRGSESGAPSNARVPGAHDVIEEGDILVVAGSNESLEQLEHLLAE